MNEMSGDLPSPLLITKNFVATSGENKIRPSHAKTTRSLKRREFSLQEAGRALAIGPHPSIHSNPFLVRSSNDASGD